MSPDPSEHGRAGNPRPSDGARCYHRIVATHPIITSVMLGCTLIGAALGFILLGEDCSTARRIPGSAAGGAGVWLLMTAARMIG